MTADCGLAGAPADGKASGGGKWLSWRSQTTSVSASCHGAFERLEPDQAERDDVRRARLSDQEAAQRQQAHDKVR